MSEQIIAKLDEIEANTVAKIEESKAEAVKAVEEAVISFDEKVAALEAKARAEESLADKSGKLDYATAQSQLQQAVMQLRTLDRFRKRGG